MREYRAWSPKNQCYFYQSELESEEFIFTVTPSGMQLLLLEETWCCGSGEWEPSYHYEAEEAAIFEQYIGRIDSERTMIFEGDFCECTMEDEHGKYLGKYLGKVFYCDVECQHYLELTDDYWPVASFRCVRDIKVLDSATANPELMEEVDAE